MRKAILAMHPPDATNAAPTGQAIDGAAIDAALARLGYDGFRPGQRQAIEQLVAGGKLLLVAPTGGGKSLCYQLPALLFSGTTLVVSPLIALMHDQVEGLARRGVPATFFASTLDPEEMRERMRAMRRGAYRIVYAAPERLVLDGFRAMLRELSCPLIAIDEAHCISEWGHDFRPEYMKIGELLQEFPDARVLACTATATPVVRDEILTRLGLPPETPQLVQGFARPNLALEVCDVGGAKDRQRGVDGLLTRALGGPRSEQGSAIIYAPTRKATEEEAARLSRQGWRAAAYHAGMPGAEREAMQDRFIRGETQVAVATNAFGMGIDRGDVRCVIHLAPPGSIEAYYQEVGRAGRDGEDAVGLLMVSASDMPLRRSLLTRPNPDGTQVPAAVVEHKWGLYLELMRWAEGGTCRHDAILRYFGDEQELLSGCGRCDNCQLLADPNQGADTEEVQLVVRKALSGIARIHGRFGMMAAVQLLRGVSDPRLARARFDQLKTFGILQDKSEAFVLALLRRCVTAGWVDFVGQDRPMAVLTEKGQQVMRAELPARILLPSEKPRARRQGARRGQDGAGAHVAHAEVPLDPKAQAVFGSLRQVRLRLSQEAKVPPYVVASDRTLRDLANLRPRNLDELRMAHGIGAAKAERYGAALLAGISGAAH